MMVPLLSRSAAGARAMAALAGVLLVLAGTIPSEAQPAAANTARGRYTATLAKERELRSPARFTAAPVTDFHALIAEYDAIVRLHPGSPSSANALWQAAGLALDTYVRFGDERDRTLGLQRLRDLAARYPTSSLMPHLPERQAGLETAVHRPPPAPPEAPDAAETVTIRRIDRDLIDNLARVTIELDAEVPYRQERLQDPDRIFVDLRGATPAPGVHDAAYTDEGVSRIRLGPRPERTTRVVLDLDGVGSYSVFALYNPFRLVIDCEVDAPAPRHPGEAGIALASAERPASDGRGASRATRPVPMPHPVPPAPRARRAPAPDPPLAATAIAASAMAEAPSLPAVNSTGSYSIARQLGLGISRIVIDPGHGGQDPGARANRLVEAELVLDIALRVEKLLLQEPGIEVLLTRRTDVFIPLEERTAIANRAGADLFLSIHANASRNQNAHGIETYYLNFASNPAAAAVAARENAAAGGSMHNLPDLVKAIALNNKLDESRDLAALVQESMVRTLRAENREVRSLGVKQAPFVVLIGASMPSVLAEVSFVTNRQEAQLLRTDAYRQRIAEALADAVLRYQRSLKSAGAVAARGP